MFELCELNSSQIHLLKNCLTVARPKNLRLKGKVIELICPEILSLNGLNKEFSSILNLILALTTKKIV